MSSTKAETKHVFLQFQGADGEKTGPAVSVPADTTPQQLEALLNEILLQRDDPLPYSFFVKDVEIVTSIQKDIPERKDEGIISVVYRPQAIFRVRAVSRCTSTLSGHNEVILCAAFSPDGKILATGSGDNAVRLWDLTTETPLKALTGHQGFVLSVAWSPDGRYLASGDMNGEIRIWDARTGEPTGRPLTGHSKWITHLCWEPLHLRSPTVRLASSSKDGTVKLWDVVRRTCDITLSQHTDAVSCIRWTGSEGVIYSASRDRTIKIWDSNSGRLLGQLLGHAHWINTLALSTDHILRTGAFNHEGALPCPADDYAAIQQAARKRYEDAKSTDGERLVSGSDDFTLYLWKPESSHKPVGRLTGHQALVNHVAFSPDGRCLASGSFDKSVKIWNGLTGAFIASLRGHVGRVYQVAWSADSRLLMSCSQDSTLKVWDVRTRTIKQNLPGHLDEVYVVDWSPTGDRSASGGKDKLLKLWRQ